MNKTFSSIRLFFFIPELKKKLPAPSLSGLYDEPSAFANWRLGLTRGPDGCFLHFSFRTDWDERRSRLSIAADPSGSPIVLAVVFRREWCQLFLNGARVAQLEHGRGALYLPMLRARKRLRLGRRLRGRLTSLQLCNRALRARIIKERLATVTDGRVLDLRPAGGRVSGATARPTPALRPSACGFSICDDPRVIEAYGRLQHGPKRLRARLVNLRLDDGSQPLMTAAVRARLRRRLASTFSRTNVSFDLQELQVSHVERLLMFKWSDLAFRVFFYLQEQVKIFLLIKSK